MCEYTEGTGRLLLCELRTDGSHRCLPGTEAKRRKDKRNRLTDDLQDAAVQIIRDILEGGVKVHEYPQEHRDDEDDRAGLNHEGLCSLPDVNQNTLHGRHVVSRKLHDKRCRIAREVVHLLQCDTGENHDCEAQEVHARRHKVVGREEGN